MYIPPGPGEPLQLLHGRRVGGRTSRRKQRPRVRTLRYWKHGRGGGGGGSGGGGAASRAGSLGRGRPALELAGDEVVVPSDDGEGLVLDSLLHEGVREEVLEGDVHRHLRE